MDESASAFALVGQILQCRNLLLAAKVDEHFVAFAEPNGLRVAVGSLLPLSLVGAEDRERQRLDGLGCGVPCELCVLSAVVDAHVVEADWSARVDDAHAHALCLHGAEAQQALVADGGCLLALLNAAPCLAVEILYGELLHALSERNVLLQHDAVHELRLLEVERDGSRCDAVGSSPVGIPRVVGHRLCRERLATLVAHLRCHASHEVMLQLALNQLVEVDGVSRVDRVDETFAVDGEVEQQRSVVAHRAVVEVGKLFGRLHTVVLLRMIEPARTDRHVALGSRPLVAVGVSVLQFGVVGIARINRVLAQECPVGLACEALLVAHPAASRSAVAEHHGVGLNAVEHGKDMRVVVVVLAVDSARVLCAAIVAVAAVGSVEPHLEHVAVVGE